MKQTHNRRVGALWLLLSLLAFVGASPAWAHVGSPDIYAEGDAGTYRLFVTVRPPAVIPGVAQIEVRTSDQRIKQIQIAPAPLVGEASKHPPAPDQMKRSAEDPELYSGNLWIMASGSWQVRFTVDGLAGRGEFSVPVAAMPETILKMQPLLGSGLLVLGAFLVLGMAGIVGASVRDAQLAPGAPVPAPMRKKSRVAMAAALAVLLLAVWLGGKWWSAAADGYARNVYQPLLMRATLGGSNTLTLKLQDPATGAVGWMGHRKVDDFIPDHDHLMHLYMIREPQMDIVFHLHPSYVQPGEFDLALPSVPPGTYRLYADVVHADGFPETMVATLALPQITGRALDGDDAEGLAPAIKVADDKKNNFLLPDGYQMVWARPAVLRARRPEIFDFYLLDPQGKPPSDIALYMGMLGHAAFVRTDGGVFAHIHPSGTPSMAAMMLAQPADGTQKASPMKMIMPMGNESTNEALPNRVSFPYGFPSPGRYRIFVQMKHGNTIETGSFDADVQQ